MRKPQNKKPPFRGTSLEDSDLDGREPVDFAALLRDPKAHARTAPRTKVPKGYILFSEAIRKLAISMWGGLRRPDELQKVKQIFKKAGEPNTRIEWGRWREKAADRLTQTALEGKLVVYVTHQDQDTPTCSMAPSKVLRQLIASRSSLPDHAIRPSIKACHGDRTLFELLKTGCLVVDETEFSRWQQAEYRRGKWPSQRSRKKAGTGRPGKQTDALRNAILARVRDGVWIGHQSIVSLRQLLIDSGRDDVPSADTLARLVDELHDEIGDAELRRPARRKRSK
jgi:hypothetical protein